MKTTIIRNKLLDEIAKIPDEKLTDLYHFTHNFRLGLEVKKSNSKKILELAGSWKNMPDKDFAEFMRDIKQRRSKAFSSRRKRETSID